LAGIWDENIEWKDRKEGMEKKEGKDGRNGKRGKGEKEGRFFPPIRINKGKTPYVSTYGIVHFQWTFAS